MYRNILILISTIFIFSFGFVPSTHSDWLDDIKKGLDDASESMKETFGGKEESEAEGQNKTSVPEKVLKPSEVKPPSVEPMDLVKVEERSQVYQTCMKNSTDGIVGCVNSATKLVIICKKVLTSDPENIRVKEKLSELANKLSKTGDLNYLEVKKGGSKSVESVQNAIKCYSLLLTISPNNVTYLKRKEELTTRLDNIFKEREKVNIQKMAKRRKSRKDAGLVVKGFYLGMTLDEVKEVMNKSYSYLQCFPGDGLLSCSSTDRRKMDFAGFVFVFWTDSEGVVKYIEIRAPWYVFNTETNIGLKQFIKMFSNGYKVSPFKLKTRDLETKHEIWEFLSSRGYKIEIRGFGGKDGYVRNIAIEKVK